ncbi:response regulator [Aestuariibacter salexigens]|uniref:response regulator n=1 Tax=Aestuariibacter salexigens TaxID=226010 RepID=UPI00042A3F62|nr:response regulator [Aestuariibacter salexigens]
MAEDEEAIREVCAGYLDLLGHNSIFVAEGSAAVQTYREKWQDIDLVIMDMMMPVMNGLDAFIALQQINPSIKVMVASGYCADHTKKELRAKGVKFVLAKPFKLTELQEAINALFE